MENPWLLFAAAMAAFLGFANLENARRGLHFRPMTIFWSLVSGYLCYLHFVNLYHTGGIHLLAGLALAFCTVSPILGWIWWGWDGAIRRRLFKSVLFLFLTAAGFVLWSLSLGNGGAAVVLALLTASLPFLGIRRRLRRICWRLRSGRDRRKEERAIRQEELQEKRQRREADATLREHTQLKRELEARDRRIARLKSGEEKKRVAVVRKREELAEQIRLLREEEVQRIRQNGLGLHFHPHYGFLMAEAWRVLRAQIARGERIPAAEHDEFFHQAVAELLEPDNFENRYFHAKGRSAISAVNRYLEGRDSLAIARDTLRRLNLTASLLAPEPLSEYSGQALLEAWLVPQRRLQNRLWEDFQERRHPQQERVIRFLQERNQGLPTQDEWQALWDDHPAIFSGMIPEAVRRGETSSVPRAQRLWKAVSSIWQNAKAR